MKELHEMGVAELGRALDAKAVSSVEVTEHLLACFAVHRNLGVVDMRQIAPTIAKILGIDFAAAKQSAVNYAK